MSLFAANMQENGHRMLVNRREFLGVGAAAVAAGAQTGKRPNVLIIVADEWRAQATGYNGDRNVIAPTLDRLELQSANFENAVAGCPVCCPARASMITGQYPLTNGVFINDVELKPNAPTLAEVFGKAGYKTGFIGKWHLYGSPDGNYGRRLAYIPPEKRFGFEYWKACECTHDYNHSLYYADNDPTPKYWPGYDAFAQTEDACGFIDRNVKTAKPFLLFLSLGPPHFPYQTAPEPYKARFKDVEIQLRPNVPEAKRAEATDILRGYYAHMAAVDDCLAKLLATLERNQITDDTIVVFASDHGDMMLSQGLTTKLYPWEESVRVPLLVRYPRKVKPARKAAPVQHEDLMPTLLTLAGLEIPRAVQGRDMFHKPADGAALLTLAVPITEARRYGFAEYRGVRTADRTYVRSIHGPWLLYNNREDPYQEQNLIGKDDRTQARLESVLQAELRRVHDEFLPAAEYIRRANVGHYREVTIKAGKTKSPWGDWESTM